MKDSFREKEKLFDPEKERKKRESYSIKLENFPKEKNEKKNQFRNRSKKKIRKPI